VEWLFDAPRETFDTMLMPGVKLDPATLSVAVQSVIGQLQRQAGSEPTGRPTRAATTPAAIIAPPQPATPQIEPVALVEDDADDDRHNLVGSMITIYRRVINTLPDYEAVTGCYSHAGQLRRALETAIKDLEGNLV
jgi:hypothetical protein